MAASRGAGVSAQSRKARITSAQDSGVRKAAMPASPSIRRETSACGTRKAATGFASPDRAAPVLEAVSAGHVPAFVIGERGLTEIASTGPALGIIPDFEWTGTVTPFRPGETLFHYTDGLTELRSPAGEFFGDARLRALLRADRSPKDLIGEIIEAALPFCKGTLHDDLAMTALRRL